MVYGLKYIYANLFLRKKTIRKIVGDPVWEKFYTQYKIDDDFDQFQEKKYNIKNSILKFLRNTIEIKILQYCSIKTFNEFCKKSRI